MRAGTAWLPSLARQQPRGLTEHKTDRPCEAERPGDRERAHYVYAVLDLDLKGYDISVGIGRGMQNAGDKWVAKAIIAFPFR